MPWFKVDDQLAVHMKAVTAGNQAMGLWVRAGSWCMAQLTDGFLPGSMVAALGGSPDDARSLSEAGLWHPVPGGWQFHDWSEYQPTRESVLAEREATRQRVAKHRENKVSNNGRNTVTNGVGTTPPVPVPDNYLRSKSQSRNNRARVSTDTNPISAMTKRLAAQKGITSLRAVVDAIIQHTNVTPTADQAYQLCLHLLDKATSWPDAPQRYVLACIEQSPVEVEKHLYERIGVAS